MELGLELKCKGEQIVPVQTVNNRGIIVDKYLTFASQVESVCNKANGKVATFRHGGRNMTTAARRTFYLSIIQSTFDYASSAYYYCLHTNTYNKILTTSRNCIRRIFGLHRCTHFNLVQQKYNLSSIENRANLKLFVFIYRCLNSLTSSSITSMFTPRSIPSLTKAVTRGHVNSGLALPTVFTRYVLTSISLLAAERWNTLPTECRQAPSLPKFASCTKTFLGFPVNGPAS